MGGDFARQLYEGVQGNNSRVGSSEGSFRRGARHSEVPFPKIGEILSSGIFSMHPSNIAIRGPGRMDH